ncbi:MAG: ATP-binding cassette domain-containing protein, partial [Gemmatimonadota bacterium]|nr:ATP-binding cassette domain-containing protein [Gemmatimonadota bacterium]
MNPTLVRLRGVERRFGSVVALAGAELELRAGEVHGVLGANGAGKSTLFNVLGGLLRPDGGTIEVDGRPVVLTSPRDAWAHGIGLVHQHFTLVPTLTVSENLALGLRGALEPGLSVQRAVRELIERTGLDVPLQPRVEELGVGDRQRIEILKALLRDPRILVLDEPTAVLTPD